MMKLLSSAGMAVASMVMVLASASLSAHGSGSTTLAPRKPNDSGVTLTYRIDATPQLGRVTPVVLQFDGVTSADGAAVRLSTDAGLAVQGATSLKVPSGKSTTATVLLVSESEGLSYLHVFMAQGGGMSAVSVPIQTGTTAAAMKSSGELKRNSRGDQIISMPAK